VYEKIIINAQLVSDKCQLGLVEFDDVLHYTIKENSLGIEKGGSLELGEQSIIYELQPYIMKPL
jgi:hypothetical protein